jgi:adenosylcobinamide kinase/adenosylcobinamide-phosphate guanylyltransferase
LGYAGFDGRAGRLLVFFLRSHLPGYVFIPILCIGGNFRFNCGAKLITLVLGGVRSGKSRYAQTLAMTAKDVAFLATAQPSDDEMRAKIARHREERPAHWETVEVPLALDTAIAEQGSRFSFLLIDCLTTFTANLLMAEGDDSEKLMARVDRVCNAIQGTPASVALVSNEVGSGIVPPFPSGRQFRDLLGEMNQKIARISDNVILMIAGCPLAIKGLAEVRQ